MDELLTSSPGSSEPDSPGGLNRGCLFDPADLLSVIVPETPSPRLRKCRRRRCNTDQLITPVTGGGSQRRAEQASSSEGASQSRSKRAAPAAEGAEPDASSPPSFLEDASVDTAPSSVSGPSSSSLTGPSEEAELMAASSTGSPCGVGESRKSKRRKMRSSSSSSSSSVLDSDALSFLTDEERKWLRGEGGVTAVMSPVAAAEEIVISDDDEAVVRAAQMEEDEAFARSLQAEFDQEEARNQQNQHQHSLNQQNQYRQALHQQNQYQQALHQQNQSPREQSPSRFYSGVQPRWMSQVLAAVTPPAGREEESAGQRRGRGRSRRRNALPDLSEDSQGNNYEALLEFEDRQGAVKSKLTRREIQRFPTKIFVSTNNGGNTQCQICFCDYAAGDKQRMLSCFHDYHVQCIDRWLKDNTTCPICRANMGHPLTSD